MTASDMLRRIVGYYGAYPADRPVLAEEVATYLDKLRPTYLDSMWPVLRDHRPVYRGPPDVQALRELHEPILTVEQCRRPVSLPGPESSEPHDYIARELGAVLEKLQTKVGQQAQEAKSDIASAFKPSKRFANLDGVRWDTPVSLQPEFYDETISMEERMRRYATNYKGKRHEDMDGRKG